MERITSRQNPIVARFREAARRARPTLLLEGASLVEAALDAGVVVELAAIHLEGGAPAAGHASTLRRLEAAGTRVVAVSRPVLDAVSPAPSPSGLVALAGRPSPRPEALLTPAPALVLVLVDVQDPGNVGAIVRAADAAGATGVVATTGCADPFGWKALRGSMGSVLRMPIWPGIPWPEALGFLRTHGLFIVAADARASRAFTDQAWPRPSALLLGSEGSGLPAAMVEAADAAVAIPMRPGVESLNVAVTAALIVYEARRQRHRSLRPSR